MRILLIQPRDITYNRHSGAFERSGAYPAMTLPLLAALIPPEVQADVRILDEGGDVTPIDYDVDLIGLTAYTASANRAYAIADEARARGVYVVMGGYHASANPDEARAHVDTVIIGQAERTWPRFLLDFNRGTPLPIYMEEGELHLSDLPRIRRDLINRKLYFPAEIIQASRGCANGCDFCSISHHLGHRTLQRPIGALIDEIRTLPSRIIIFLDPNFHVDMAYAKELMTALIPLKRQWTCLTTVDTADDEEALRLMRESGCFGVLLGFESICPATLQRMHKAFNHVERYRAYLERFHIYRQAVLGCFIFGFDEDDPSVFENTLDFIDQVRIDLPRFAVLTPFPGTPLFTRLEAERRIFHRNWDDYNFEHVVFHPARMSARQLQEGLLCTWREAYTWRRILRRVAKMNQRRLFALAANLSFQRFGQRLVGISDLINLPG
jgi:radical SAM superfamily enzyme YgiQ (UPF0313 family)